MKKIISLIVALLLFGFNNQLIFAQSSIVIDTAFNEGEVGPNNGIYDMVKNEDGGLYIGGFFTSYNGITRRKIARINNDGTLDTTFNSGNGTTGGAGTIFQIEKIPNSEQIIISGWWNLYNGVNQVSIARINNDGTLDTTFNSGNTGFPTSSLVYTSLITQDEKILLGGIFSNYNNENHNNIIKLNSDGSIDETFDSGSGFNGDVISITEDTQGRFLVSGNFSQYKDTPVNYLVRLNSDGTIDESFTNLGFNSIIGKTTIQSDGKIIVIGYFTEYNNLPFGGIVRLNSDGSIDETFDSGSGFLDNTMHEFTELLMFEDDSFIIGGLNLQSYNGNEIFGFVKIDSEGEFQDTFDISELNYLGNIERINNESLVKIDNESFMAHLYAINEFDEELFLLYKFNIVDTESPTAHLSLKNTNPEPITSSPFIVILETSEPINPSSFMVDDIQLSGVDESEIIEINMINNSLFEILIQINESGNLTVTIPENSFEDMSNNTNTDPIELSVIITFTTPEEPTPTPRRSSGGGFASPAFLASLGITLNNQPNTPCPAGALFNPATGVRCEGSTTPSLDQPGLCSADQILTQNLRAPSRNGAFNSYTGGIVREINILQGHLNRLGFNSGPIDGIAGLLTDGAIKRMQTFLGTTPDGYVGPITRGLLNNSCGDGLQG